MRRLGDSVDWSRERFTMDEGSNRAVLTMFKRLYDDGLIYRAERMVNWSPEMRSVLSDVEVEHKDVDGELVSIRYGDGEDSVVVATTRVETMLGDTAVAVHPDDERYRHLIGRQIELPLVGRMIPVIADEHVDPAFGTGAVKITPAHDPNDFEIGRRHDLPMPTIMDETGHIAGTGTEFDGLDRFEARIAVKEALRAQGRIVAEKRPYRHSVGHAQRGKFEPIEPRLSLQWFVKVGPLAKAAGDAVRSGDVVVHPKELEPRWFAWVDNMHDWCISRQLWWGHRIPVWYGPGGEVVCCGPGRGAARGLRPGRGRARHLVLLGAVAVLHAGLAGRTRADLAKFYPTSVLVTGYDILFFWVARMMMFGLYAMDGVRPFDTIALHGMVRDQYGKKMSKTVGNTVDPNEWMDVYGTDATRFALARGANPGVDAPIGDDNVAAARNFGTKLWNATRFALANGASPGAAAAAPGARDRRRRVDPRAAARGHRAGRRAARGLPVRQGHRGALPLHVGRAVRLVPGAGQAAARGGRARPTAPARCSATSSTCCCGCCTRSSPFVTETLYQALTGGESVVIAPLADRRRASRSTPAAARRIADLQTLVTEVRRFRTEQGVPDKRRGRGPARRARRGRLGAHRGRSARSCGWTSRGPDSRRRPRSRSRCPAATVVVELDTSGAIDVAAERARLGRDLAAAQKELDQARRRSWATRRSWRKAPAQVVDEIRGRQAKAAADIERITARLAALPT